MPASQLGAGVALGSHRSPLGRPTAHMPALDSGLYVKGKPVKWRNRPVHLPAQSGVRRFRRQRPKLRLSAKAHLCLSTLLAALLAALLSDAGSGGFEEPPEHRFRFEIGAEGGIRTHTRNYPQRFLRPPRLPFRHFGPGMPVQYYDRRIGPLPRPRTPRPQSGFIDFDCRYPQAPRPELVFLAVQPAPAWSWSSTSTSDPPMPVSARRTPPRSTSCCRTSRRRFRGC